MGLIQSMDLKGREVYMQRKGVFGLGRSLNPIPAPMAIESIGFEDRTGQPRSDEDIQEAIQAVEHAMVKNMLKVPPKLAVMLPTIREALKELLVLRQKLNG